MTVPFPVQWADVNLQDLLPEEIVSLVQDVLVPITDFVVTSAEASKAYFEILKLTSGFIPPTADPILLGIQASVDSLSSLLNDLENAGGTLLVVPPIQGGLDGFGNFIRSQLSNLRKPDVPNFSEEAFIGSFGALAYAPDLVSIELIHDDLVAQVSVDDNLIRKLQLDTLVDTATYHSHSLKYKIAKTASPQPDSPWVTLQASQFIPKSGEITEDIRAYLSGINTQVAVNPLDDIIALAQGSIDNATALASSLQTTAEFIESVFPDLPLKFFKQSATDGGTAGLSESTKDWFDKTKHPELAEIPNNSWMSGYIVVWGGPDFDSVQNIYDIWNDLFLP